MFPTWKYSIILRYNINVLTVKIAKHYSMADHVANVNGQMELIGADDVWYIDNVIIT